MPPPGALGVATGAIAIGTAATSTSTTTITLIRTTISIATSTGDKADKVTGSTTHNTGGMHHMATGEPQTSSAVRVPAEPEIAAVQVIGQEALAELDVPVAQVELEALAGLEDQVVPAVRAALVVPENPVVLVAPGDPVVRAASVVPESPVELALAPGAVALRTKSATAAHHRGLVAVPRVEDSAAAAETTREPAATEAEKAWAVAVTAAAVAVVVVVE